MSVQLMAAVFERGPSNPHLRLLMLAIADHADDEGLAWPGVERLAAKCAVSARSVQRSLQQLEAAGWLVIEHGKGRGNTNLYRLAVDRLLMPPPQRKGDAHDTHSWVQKGDAGSAKGDVHAIETVTPASPETSVVNLQEPSITARPAESAPTRLIDLTEVADWLSLLHPDLAVNARTAPPATSAMSNSISPDSARRLLEAAGHRTDRAAVVAHVLPNVIAAEVERRRVAGERRRAAAEAAQARRSSDPVIEWPDHLSGQPITMKLAWLRTEDGVAWAEDSASEDCEAAAMGRS